MTQVIEDALRVAVARKPRTARSRVDIPTFRGDGLQPGIDLDNSAALQDVMEKFDPAS